MSKKTSRIIKLVLVLLIGIIAVYNAINPGDGSSSQGEQNTSGIEQTLATLATSSDVDEGTSEQQTSTTEQQTSTTEQQTTTEAPTTAGASSDATIVETSSEVESTAETITPEPTTVRIKENGTYTSKEDVAEYLHLYGHLPSNYITKDEAKDLGWVSNKGNLWDVAPGKSIGGDYFGNFEGLLPKKSGRKYYECDIDFEGSYRGSKRIIFSNDGLIYYTEDHYESFECLYGK